MEEAKYLVLSPGLVYNLDHARSIKTTSGRDVSGRLFEFYDNLLTSEETLVNGSEYLVDRPNPASNITTMVEDFDPTVSYDITIMHYFRRGVSIVHWMFHNDSQ